jgi:signal transduction histidine kinase
MLKFGGEGVRRYFVASTLDEASELFVAVGLPYERVVRETNRAFYRTLGALALLTLFTIAAVFIAAELGILRGVRSLARVAQRFGAGELSARAKAPRGHNEFASLAATFNAMADSLEARHREAVEGQAQLRALASRLQVAQETEASRISRELHDEIGQMLTSLKIDLSRLQSHCPVNELNTSCATDLRESIGAMNQQIDTAVDFVRRISAELRPGVLDKLGLTAALEWLARSFENRTDLVIEVEADNVDAALDEKISVPLFRITQEALTNVVRHAQADVVRISLANTEQEIVLTISDDGHGIATDAAENSGSLGIIGMRERAMLIHGQLSIQGSPGPETPGQGTTVIVTVPLHPPIGDR